MEETIEHTKFTLLRTRRCGSQARDTVRCDLEVRVSRSSFRHPFPGAQEISGSILRIIFVSFLLFLFYILAVVETELGLHWQSGRLPLQTSPAQVHLEYR
jgi:hypothetical protein